MVMEADLMAMLDEQSDVAMEWLACDSAMPFVGFRAVPGWKDDVPVFIDVLPETDARVLLRASRYRAQDN